MADTSIARSSFNVVLAALGTLALGAMGTVAIQFGVRPVPAHRVAAPARQGGSS